VQLVAKAGVFQEQIPSTNILNHPFYNSFFEIK
jgi:hypothetical protein